MPKFRKKPVVIEAFKLDEENQTIEDTPLWFQAAWEKGDVYRKSSNPQSLEVYIKTLEGDHKANNGDWIIQGIEGELYPCKPDIFEATYDLEPTETLSNTEAA